MDNEDIQKISLAVLKDLEKSRTINVETHRKHHEFIDIMIEREKKSQDRKEKWIQIVGGWGIITVLTGLGLAVFHFVRDHMNNGGS